MSHDKSGTVKVKICDMSGPFAPVKEQEANAKLIAAAPKLVEEAIATIYLISEDENDYPDSELYRMTMSRIESLKEAVEAAIGPQDWPEPEID